MNIPENLLYTKEHEWIKIEDNTATIGITDYAQSELGDIVFLEFPNIGDKFEQNDIFGTIEAVKTLADLYIPIGGEIIENNDELDSNPELINSSPYDEGWIVKISLTNTDDIKSLLNAADYKSLIS